MVKVWFKLLDAAGIVFADAGFMGLDSVSIGCVVAECSDIAWSGTGCVDDSFAGTVCIDDGSACTGCVDNECARPGCVAIRCVDIGCSGKDCANSESPENADADNVCAMTGFEGKDWLGVDCTGID